jgi:hypothetical protein
MSYDSGFGFYSQKYFLKWSEMCLKKQFYFLLYY